MSIGLPKVLANLSDMGVKATDVPFLKSYIINDLQKDDYGFWETIDD